MASYDESYAAWQHDPEGFWAQAARDIAWFRPAVKAFSAKSGVYGRWFEGPQCNQDHKVAAMFTAPTAFRAIKKEDPTGALINRYDLSRFRTLFLAGERSDPATIEWAQDKLQRPVIDHWWQTETGWAMSGNPQGLGGFPVKLGSPGKPMPGFDIHVLDDDGNAVPPGTLGNIVCKLPLPPSGFPTFWQAPERFLLSCMEEFPGYYATSDAGIEKELVTLIRARIGAVAAFKTAVPIQRLPKTRSGKVLRGTIQKIADAQDFKMPAAIDDPAILDEIRDALQEQGLIG